MQDANDLDIRRQSESAYKQWCVQWRKQAAENKEIAERKWGGFKSLENFYNTGIGKFCLLVANGYSFEAQIETVQKHWENVDAVACDKTLGKLLAHGIKPKYCIVCDANVSFEKYLEPWADQLSETIMLGNVCGNPKWSEAGWKDAYFFINEDILNSHLEFQKLSGCNNFIIAGTNVSNAMLIMMTQSRAEGRANVFGYDRYLLLGFDYCWSDASYYAFDRDGGGKMNYMRHLFLNDIFANDVYTSNNLLFSARWINKYITTYGIRAIQCSKTTLLPAAEIGNLEKLIKYKYQPEDSQKVRNLVSYRKSILLKIAEIDTALSQIEKDHHIAALKFA